MKHRLAPFRRGLPFLWITLACVLYALGFNWFFMPNQIAYGGVTGIAQIIHALLGRPSIGLLIIVMNLPLFLAGWRLLGRRLVVMSLFAMALSSVLIDLLAALYAFPTMEPLLASIYGGVFIGASLGIIFAQDATTGGTDIAARLVRRRLSWLPMGRIMLMLDLVVIVGAALVFRQLNSALYGLVSLYISSLVMDGMLYGSDPAKVAYIISERHDAIAAEIGSRINRGVTILHGEGAWSGAEKRVLLCAVKVRQMPALKRTVKELDPDAFLIVCDAHEVLGDGFGSHHSNDF